MNSIAALLLLGLFTEVRTPADGYQCLVVRRDKDLFVAIKYERSRLSGRVTLTMPVQNLRVQLGLPPDAGRTIDLESSDMVADASTCSCPLTLTRDLTCADR